MLSDWCGPITADTTWDTDANLTCDVWIRSGATLTISPGVTVTQSHGDYDLHVSDDGSGARLMANGVTFMPEVEVYFYDGAMGTVTGSTFNGPVYQYSGTKATPRVSFSGNTFLALNPVYTYGALVEDFTDDNTFNHSSGPSTITIQGGTLIEDASWQVSGTASRYLINNHFTVDVGATLEIGTGVEISTNLYDSSRRIYNFNVDGTANAAGVTFTDYTNLNARNGGTLNLSGTTASGGNVYFESSEIEYQAGSAGTIICSTFNIPVHYQPGAMGTVRYTKFNIPITLSTPLAWSIRESDFSSSTVEAIGESTSTIDLTYNWWGTIDPALIEERIIHQPDDPSRPLVIFDPFLMMPPQSHDLIAESVEVIAGNPIAGASITLQYAIANNGPGADPVQTRTYFSLNTGPGLVDSHTLAIVSTEPIPAPEVGDPANVVVHTVDVQLPPGNNPIWTQDLPEIYTISMRVDALGEIPECNETNNLASMNVTVIPPIPGDFDSDLDVDGDDLDIWEGGFGTTTEANLDDGDSDVDMDVDGIDFLNWQRNYSPSIASEAVAGSSAGSGATDAGGTFIGMTDAAVDSSNDTTTVPLRPVLARGIGQDSPVPRPDRHGLAFESVAFAGWSLPQPMPKTNGSMSAWLDLPQFQSHKTTVQDRPFQRDLAVDTVMSRLDALTPRDALKRFHEAAEDTAFSYVTTKHDDSARSIGGVAKIRQHDAPINRADLEVAFEELRDALWN